jgi:hypothetical protein
VVRLIFVAVIGLAILAAVRHDLRARRRGTRVTSDKVMKNEAIQSRMDVESFHSPSVQGGSMDWATYRSRDRKSSSWRRQR